MRCPRCGKPIPAKLLAAELGKRGGSKGGRKKSEAARKREERKKAHIKV